MQRRAATARPSTTNVQDTGRMSRGRHEWPVRSPVDLPRPSASPPTKRRPSRGHALRTSTDKVLSSFVAALPSNGRQRRSESAQRSGTPAGRTSAVWTSITDVLSRSLGAAARVRRASAASSQYRRSSSPDSFRESARDARRARWDRSARAGTLWRKEDPSPPLPRKPRSQSVPSMRGDVETAHAADNAARVNRAVSPATHRLCQKQVSPSALRPRTSPSFLRSMLWLKLSPPLVRHRASPEVALRRLQKQHSPSAPRPRVSPLRVRDQPGGTSNAHLSPQASSRPREMGPVEELGRDDVHIPALVCERPFG